MTKYERIIREKLTDKGKAYYDKVILATDNFKDKAAIKENKASLDVFFDRVKAGIPEAIRPVKAKTPAKKSKAKKAAPKKASYKNVNMGNFAKEAAALAKKEGIPYREAQKKVSALNKKRKEDAKKDSLDKFDTLIAGLKKKIKYEGGKGLTNTNLSRDSKLEAKPFGKRVSKGTGSNQHGKSKKGNIYYENRNNRGDVNPKKFPKLAKGGVLSTHDRYVLELAGLTGVRKTAIEKLVKDNNLSDSEFLNIIVGVGRKQINRSVVVDAVMGGISSKPNKDLVKFAKSDKAIKKAKGGNVEEQEYYDSFESVGKLHKIASKSANVTDVSEIDEADDDGIIGESFDFTFKGRNVKIFYDPGYQEFTMFSESGDDGEPIDEESLVSFLAGENYATGGITEVGDVDFPEHLLGYAKGGNIKGRNNKTGKSFGVVIGSKEFVHDDKDRIKLNVRSGYSSRISERELVFDKKGNLIETTDYGYTLDGTLPNTNSGSGSYIGASNKKETITKLIDLGYNKGFANKLIDFVKEDDFAKGGEVGYYVTWMEDGQEDNERFGANELDEAKDFYKQIKSEKFSYEKPKVSLTSAKDGSIVMGKEFAKGGKVKDLNEHFNQYSDYNYTYYVTENKDGSYKMALSYGDKRGYPRDAEIKAMRKSPPSLPSGFVYVNSSPQNYDGSPMTRESIKESDDLYSDRGYQEREFDGQSYWTIKKESKPKKQTKEKSSKGKTYKFETPMPFSMAKSDLVENGFDAKKIKQIKGTDAFTISGIIDRKVKVPTIDSLYGVVETLGDVIIYDEINGSWELLDIDYYAKGGVIEINEDGSNIPSELMEVFSEFNEDEDSYKEMERLRLKAQEIGYDFDYDLSGQPTEFFEFDDYAKGGKAKPKNMKGDKDWIQDVTQGMKKRGTVGSFTIQAKREGMSTIAFANEVLSNTDKYSKLTRERAQFMKNVNPELFSTGGITEVGDVDFPEHLLGYSKGGMTKAIQDKFKMPADLKKKLYDSKGVRKIDKESIDLLADYTNNIMPQTRDIYKIDGVYTKERQVLHKEIIDEFKANLVCIQQKEPIAILMGGSPASGKSTFLKKYAPYLLDDEILRIDADETRAKLPEYEGWNASATHLETKDIVNTLLSDRTIGLPCSYDVIYDGTMNNTKSYLPLIELLKELNYKIFVVYIDNVPKPAIEKRIVERYQRSGRFVPLEVVDDFFDKGKNALNEIKRKVDGYMIVDGSDSSYKVIEEKGMKLPKSRKYSQIGTSINKMATGGEIFSQEIAQSYDVNIPYGTYANGGQLNWLVEDGKVMRNGETIAYYDFDRDSDSFWINMGAQDKSFQEKEDIINFFKKRDYAKGGKTKSIMSKKDIGVVIPKTYQIGDKEFGNTYKVERVNTKKYSDNDKNRHYNFRIWEYDKSLDLFDEIKSPSGKLKALERIEMSKDYAKGGSVKHECGLSKKALDDVNQFLNMQIEKAEKRIRKYGVSENLSTSGEIDGYTNALKTIEFFGKQNYAKGGKTQGYNDRLDESLAMRRGKSKSVSYKGRRNESKGMEKSKGNRSYSSVKSMDKTGINFEDYYAKGGKVEIEKAKKELTKAKQTGVSSAIDKASRNLDVVSEKYGYYAKGGKSVSYKGRK